MSEDKLLEAAENVFKNSMQVNEDEKVLIISDSGKIDIASVFLDACRKFSSKIDLIEIPIGERNGSEPPLQVADKMLSYDVILGITTMSISHTKARKDASKKGARIATMPGITKEVAERTLTEDFSELKNFNLKLLKKIGNSSVVRVVSEKGTDITIPVNDNKWFDDSGVYSKAGDFGNLPAGEVTCMPAERESNGAIVVDGSVGGLGMVDSPVKIVVKDGKAVEISGGEAASQLNKQILNDDYRNIAEFAFGTNSSAKLTGVTLEDEKVLGTVHIAIGNNESYGGNCAVPYHVDFIITSPTVYVDDKKVMEKGRFLI